MYFNISICYKFILNLSSAAFSLSLALLSCTSGVIYVCGSASPVTSGTSSLAVWCRRNVSPVYP